MSISNEAVRPVGATASFTNHDLDCDGMYLGSDGNVYDSHTLPDRIPAFEPANGEVSGARIVFVNGVLTTADAEERMCRSLAEATGAQVIGLHNGTTGDPVADGLQAIGDKATAVLHGLGLPYRNEATETLRSMIRDAIDHGEPINLFGHSQGGLIISGALTEVSKDLRDQGMTQEQIEAQLAVVHVQTFGAAAWTYPKGPDYFHHVNLADPVPDLTGLGVPDLEYLIGTAILGQNVPEPARLMIGELLAELSGRPENFVKDDGTRYHTFEHPEPWFHDDGQFDLQAHSAQLYFDRLRDDPGALGAIAKPGSAEPEIPQSSAPGHLLHVSIEIDDWAAPPESPIVNYENTHGASIPEYDSAATSDDSLPLSDRPIPAGAEWIWESVANDGPSDDGNPSKHLDNEGWTWNHADDTAIPDWGFGGGPSDGAHPTDGSADFGVDNDDA